MKRLTAIVSAVIIMLNIFNFSASAKSENLALGKAVTVKSHIANEKSYAEQDRFNENILTDGKFGDADFGNPCWAKFYRATGRTLTVDLGENCTLEGVHLRFLQNSQAGIVAPKNVSIFVSQNNTDFSKAEIKSGGASPFLPSRSEGTEIADYDIRLAPISARYVAISFDVTVNTFIDEIEIYGKSGSESEPPTEFTDIIAPPKGEYLSRNALSGDHDIVCFHAGYSPDNEVLVNNTKESFLYYVGYRDENKKITDTMFDSVMFLTLQGKCPSGGDLTISGGETVMSDWETLLDSYFHPEYNLFALDAATSEVKEALGLDSDYKTSVYLTIPYPKIGDIEFGDYDGDGKADKIDSYQATLDVTEWFMDEVDRRFSKAGFENIELKGYFCNSEGITRQRFDYEWDFARDAAALMHERGLYCVMIPYYQAVGIDANDEFNFDAMLMQPNLSFNDTLKDDPEGMMEDFAETAKQLGLGIQMEIADGVRWEPELGKYYAQYLTSASRNGIMTDTVHAYYNGAGPGVFYDCAVSKNPALRWYYDMTYKFIKGTLDLPSDMLSGDATESITVTDNSRVRGETGVAGDWYCTYNLTKSPENGHVNLFDGAKTFSYIADRNFNGTDSFVYEILYNGEVIAERSVTVTVDRSETAESPADESADPESQSSAGTENKDGGNILPILLGALFVLSAAIAAGIIISKKKNRDKRAS